MAAPTATTRLPAADVSRRLTEEIIAAAQEVVRARHDVLAGDHEMRDALDRLEALVGRPPDEP